MTDRLKTGCPRVVVVGGGLAGISAAVRLAEAGVSVTLLEALSRLGGRASSFVDGVTGEVVDNCQHVLLGCCTALVDLYRRLEVLGQIEWHRKLFFADLEGRVDVLEADDLPAPLHLMPSLLRLRLLSGAEKLSLARGMAAIARLEESDLIGLKDVTFGQWLDDHGQRGGVVEKFWSLISESAANERARKLSAGVALRVFREGFLGEADAYVVGVSRVPLVELYDQTAAVLMRGGGSVRLSTRVRSLGRKEGGRWSVVTDDGAVEADTVVSAVPPRVIGKLFPAEVVENDPWLRKTGLFEYSTIIGVHLWLECEAGRPVMKQPLLGLMGGRMHWLFNKGVSSNGQHVHAVVSAAEELAALPNEEIIGLAVEELRRSLGMGMTPRLKRGLVVKERQATFSATPAAEGARPGARATTERLYLAGDWCDTGWPATMEGAVRSGEMAARALLEDWGVKEEGAKRDRGEQN